MSESEQDERTAPLYVKRDKTQRLIVCLREKAREVLEQMGKPVFGVQDARGSLSMYADLGRDPVREFGVREAPMFSFASGEDVNNLISEIQQTEKTLAQTIEAIRFAGGHV